MRTDHVTAWLIYQWLQQNAPDITDEWSFDVDDQIKGMAQGVAGLLPNVEIQIVGQHSLARVLIDQWNLENVALLGGGAPTPLSPRLDQILYYTDDNLDAVNDAIHAGYNALQVNVTNADDLQKLDGATTAVASGLMHFLPDAAVSGVFNGLSEAGFHMVVFNHGNRNAEEGGAEIRERYAKMGITIYPRIVDELWTLVPHGWSLEQIVPQPECFVDDPLLAPYVNEMPNITDVYQLVRE